MKTFLSIFVSLHLFLSVSFLQPKISVASMTAPWSSTFNCSDWDQTLGIGGNQVNCDGFSGVGNWQCDVNHPDQITAAANNPGGGGGKGWRHWVGDGKDINGTGMKITFTTPLNEFWFRWYVRYQVGFQWSSIGYDKILYMFNASNSPYPVIEYYGGSWRDYDSSGTQYVTPNGSGWYHTIANGGTTSDGNFHEYEVHIKMDTNGSDGAFELWDNDVNIASFLNSNQGTKGPLSYIEVGVNQMTPNNGGCYYVDYDDLALSTTGPIGGIPGTIRPQSPPNFQVK